MKCPNCLSSPVANRPENGCILAALIQVARERGDMSEAALRKLHANANVDALWNDVGAIVDKLETGDYS